MPKHTDAAAKMNPKSAEAFANLAAALDYRGDYVLAESAYHKSLEAAPFQAGTLQNYADNLMAQRLRLRLALVFDEKKEAQEKLALLRQLAPDDEFTRTTRVALAVDDWTRARNSLLADLERQGIRGFWTEGSAAAKESLKATAQAFGQAHSHSNKNSIANSDSNTNANAEAWKLPGDGAALPFSSSDFASLRDDGTNPFSSLDETRMPEAFNTGESLANVRGDSDRYTLLRGFKIVSGPGNSGEAPVRGGEHPPAALESTTLAGIYEAQGLPLKAIEIYDRLLKETPGDATLVARRDAAQENAVWQLAGRVGATRVTSAGAAKEEKIRKLERLLSRLEALP